MNTLRNTVCSTKNGFTLVEMAIVLVIVGLLIGGGFSTLGAYLDNAKQSHTLGSLKVTKQALLNYVKVNKHMPCPDIDGDGKGDSVGSLGTQCSSDVGTIPFDDIGLGQSVTSDDYGNLFGYGIHKEAATPEVMGLNIAVSSEEAALQGFAGSYFYNIGAPAFNLDTPPTEAIPGSLVNSYQVCNRHAANDCSGANDIEVQFIPAVIVAFNENGSGTNLASCGTASRGERETENCNADMRLIRGSFQEGVFDDQIVTISAYEIKENALGNFKDPPKAASTPSDFEFAGYDTIYLRNVNDTNDINTTDKEDNSFYIGAERNADGTINNEGEDGDLTVSVGFGSGDDELYVEGDIDNESGSLNSIKITFADGRDSFTLEGDLKGNVDLGDGVDFARVEGVIYGTLTGGNGSDTIQLYGSLNSEGTIDQGSNKDALGGDETLSDNDTLELYDTLALASGTSNYIDGDIDMDHGNDTISIYGTAFTFGSSVVIDGGDGYDTLDLKDLTLAEFKILTGDDDPSDNSGAVRNFNNVRVPSVP